MLSILLFWTFSVPSSSAEIKPLSSALHVFPHVGNDRGNVKALDRTLTDFLKVTMSEKTEEGGLTKIGESTSQSEFMQRAFDFISETATVPSGGCPLTVRIPRL